MNNRLNTQRLIPHIEGNGDEPPHNYIGAWDS